jgi:hypothetical protein
MLRAPTAEAANLTRSGNVVEKEWDEHSPLVFGILQPPPNQNGCSDNEFPADKMLTFDISVLARLAGSSFDVNKIYVDGVGTGEVALDVWLTDWQRRPGYGRELPSLFEGTNWNQKKISICVGGTVLALTSDNALQSIVFWYDGSISMDTDNGSDATDADESVTASGNGQTGSGFGGSGTSTSATDSASSGKPDFIVTSLRLRNSGGTEKYEFDPGQTISMEAVIKNAGDVDSPRDIDVRYYLSDGYKKDSSGDRIKVGTENIRDYNMEVGESKTETATLNAPNNPGKIYNIIACADGGHVVDEKHESNNCSSEAVFRINGPFNFIIQSISLGYGKTSLGIGESFNVDVIAKNIGDDSPTDTKVGYYISGGSIGTAPVFIGTDSIKEANFKSGVLKSETLGGVVAPKTPGIYTLTACVDFGNRVKESDENDNCTSMNVQVNDPSPNPAHRKTSTSILQLLFAE